MVFTVLYIFTKKDGILLSKKWQLQGSKGLMNRQVWIHYCQALVQIKNKYTSVWKLWWSIGTKWLLRLETGSELDNTLDSFLVAVVSLQVQGDNIVSYCFGLENSTCNWLWNCFSFGCWILVDSNNPTDSNWLHNNDAVVKTQKIRTNRIKK